MLLLLFNILSPRYVTRPNDGLPSRILIPAQCNRPNIVCLSET